MKFQDLLRVASEQPLFETGFLLSGHVDPRDVQRQLSRWTRAGKVLQLRRGLYTLAAPYRKVDPHPFVVANHLLRPSYVSLQSALAHHGLIPEYVPVVTSVTTGRPGSWSTPLGRFSFRHIRVDLLSGCRKVEVAPRQDALVASPEKALLDLVYLEPGADAPEYLRELRLQNLERLDLRSLHRFARDLKRPKLKRALNTLAARTESEAEEHETL